MRLSSPSPPTARPGRSPEPPPSHLETAGSRVAGVNRVNRQLPAGGKRGNRQQAATLRERGGVCARAPAAGGGGLPPLSLQSAAQAAAPAISRIR
jgi:hypothetical protein